MVMKAGALALVVGALMGLGACSGDDDSAGETAGAVVTTSTTAADGGQEEAADAAMEMLGLFGSGDWGAFYDRLAPAQQELVSRDQYLTSCVDEALAESIGRADLEVVDTEAGTVTLSGTGEEVDGVQVTYSMEWDQGTDTATMTVVHDRGGWHWTMANLEECTGTT